MRHEVVELHACAKLRGEGVTADAADVGEMRGELAQRLSELWRGFVVRAPAVIDRGLRKDGGRDVVVFRVFQAPALATHLGGGVGDARVAAACVCGGVVGVAGENGLGDAFCVRLWRAEAMFPMSCCMSKTLCDSASCERVMPESCAAALAAFCAISLRRVTRSACALSCAWRFSMAIRSRSARATSAFAAA
jgi:hypothetical protein